MDFINLGESRPRKSRYAEQFDRDTRRISANAAMVNAQANATAVPISQQNLQVRQAELLRQQARDFQDQLESTRTYELRKRNQALDEEKQKLVVAQELVKKVTKVAMSLDPDFVNGVSKNVDASGNQVPNPNLANYEASPNGKAMAKAIKDLVGDTFTRDKAGNILYYSEKAQGEDIMADLKAGIMQKAALGVELEQADYNVLNLADFDPALRAIVADAIKSDPAYRAAQRANDSPKMQQIIAQKIQLFKRGPGSLFTQATEAPITDPNDPLGLRSK